MDAERGQNSAPIYMLTLIGTAQGALRWIRVFAFFAAEGREVASVRTEPVGH